MTSQYHDPIATRAYADAAVFNRPLSQLDSTLRQFLHGKPFQQAAIDVTAGALTPDGNGAIVVTYGFHRVETSGFVASDNLDTITLDPSLDRADLESFQLIITNVNAARSIVVRHNVGNIWLSGLANITLTDAKKTLQLFYNPETGFWSDLVIATAPDNPVALVPWTTLGSDISINMTGISQSYSHLVVMGMLRNAAGAGANTSLYVNGNRTQYAEGRAQYLSTLINNNSYSNNIAQITMTQLGTNTTIVLSFRFIIFNYTSTTIPKRIMGYYISGEPGLGYDLTKVNVIWKKSPVEAISQITIENNTNSINKTGSMYSLWGLV